MAYAPARKYARGRYGRRMLRAKRRLPAVRRRRTRAVYGRRVRSVGRRRVVASRGKRYSRISRFNMNPYGTRLLRVKNFKSLSFTWALNNTTKTCASTYFDPDTDWMPRSGVMDLQEAIWESYVHKKLVSFKWRLNNIRLFMETTTELPSAAPYPAEKEVSITEVPNYVFWYWRQQTAAGAPTDVDSETARFSKLIARGPKAGISGFIPINTRDWTTLSYVQAFGSSSTPAGYANVKTYLTAVKGTDYDIQSIDGNPTCRTYIKPDDPLPGGAYADPVRTVKMFVTGDLTHYITWKLMKTKT